MSILDERGLFWWHGEPIAERQFAPNSCVPGHLVIDKEGLSHLELDGTLEGVGRMFFPAVGIDSAIQGKSIQGQLKGNNQHVVLSELHRDGGRFSTDSLSYERYVGHNCIVSDVGIPENEDVSHVESFEVNLNGFEEWLGLGSITGCGNSARCALTAPYVVPTQGRIPLYTVVRTSVSANFRTLIKVTEEPDGGGIRSLSKAGRPGVPAGQWQTHHPPLH